MVPVGCLEFFLIPAVSMDDMMLQVSSAFFQRTIWIGRYVIGICFWLTLAWLMIRMLDDLVWPLVFERQ